MRLRQLKYVLEVYRCGNNISAAADALHTSQPGLSKQIQLLEAELGFAVFERTSNKVIGLTEPGQQVIEIAQRIVSDVGSLAAIRNDYQSAEGELTVATTRTYATYVLPMLVDRFLKTHRKVRVRLLQRDSAGACRAVEAGDADLAVCANVPDAFQNVVRLRSFPVPWTVIAKKGHPILAGGDLTVHELVKYPLIMHEADADDEAIVRGMFHAHGVKPNVVFSASDADITKKYVELGLGVAVLPAIAFDALHDYALGSRNAGRLFDAATTYVCLRRRACIRPFVFDFVCSVDAALTSDFVALAIRGGDRASQALDNVREEDAALSHGRDMRNPVTRTRRLAAAYRLSA